MSNIEELGENECHAGGAGDEQNSVEGGKVGMGTAVWTIDQDCVSLLGYYGVLSSLW